MCSLKAYNSLGEAGQSMKRTKPVKQQPCYLVMVLSGCSPE